MTHGQQTLSYPEIRQVDYDF